MALSRDFHPLLEAVKYIFLAPGGVFMVSSITMENQGAETLTIAPPSSMKAFEKAENKAELLNLGLVGNTYLRKKISPDSLKWLKSHGWADPQEPFNPHHSVSGRGDLSLHAILEFALESWVIAYGVSPQTPLSLHVSLEDQEYIAANFLTLNRETFAYMIPGFITNLVLEPAPPKRKRESKKQASPERSAQEKPPKKVQPFHPETKPEEAQANGALRVGYLASIKVSIQGENRKITGTILGFERGKIRLEVKGSPFVKDQVFLVPEDKVSPN
jgi:hypothetical protein